MHVYRATATATALAGLLAVATAVSGLNNHNNSAVYKSLYSLHSNSTPVFQNVSGESANPLVRVLHGSNKDTRSLVKRDDWELPVGTCAPGIPCVNGACCSKEGICGFSPAECGTDTCISDCDAKAECGQYALPESATCPLNVCCSEYGFCGTTEDFCGTGCQKGYGGCGDVEEPSCGGQSMSRTIGYYEGWASTRSCDKRLPSDIDLAPLTHLNFAFAFFHPTTFEMMPMSAGDEARYPEFTGLKSKKPSLKTWIAVGGWSFNDATNVPNTQTAFSDMASSPENRQTFINSLRHFMQTWGFDGVDLDWEYPGADDRGGTPEDTENFVHLLRDMKNAFQDEYGISVTLPASYWYLRWFDLQGMQENLDFFNIMTYDIHGVWDASNQHTGPYVLPHTNITEIKLGLDLLWRNDVDPSRVNFGLGWYGRSFTLQDPSCDRPGCIFSYGGKPGECTKSSGTLSNSEIQRIITEHNLTPTLDAEAAVKWISWDADQWVSYDDGDTIQMKMAEANKLCLGGVLLWAVDLDDSSHTSSNNLLGVGTANGFSPADAQTFRNQKEATDRAASIANSCYWTFCGGSCEKGYTSQAYAKGQVPNIHGDESCTDDTVRTLCCAPGTTMGTCSWHGWNGVGMACTTEYCPSGKEMIAMNTNSYVDDTDLQVNSNLTCNGGAQSYCCSGFVPSQIANTDSISLLGDYRGVEDDEQELSARLMPFGINSNKMACASTVGVSLLGSLGELGLLAEAILGMVAALRCAKPPNEEPEKGSQPHSFQDDVVNRLGLGAAGIGQQKPPDKPKQSVPKKTSSKYGRFTPMQYRKGQKDCQVTYECKYGEGFDEICDNMRWAIEKGLGGERVYHKNPNGRAPAEDTFAPRWYDTRHPDFRQNAVRPPWWPGTNRDSPRCNIEEFPFASLEEATGAHPYQILRLVSARVNSLHSKDWSNWLAAIFNPCKALREQQGFTPPEPPITMTWSPFEEGDNRIKANEEPPHNAAPHFIEAYGFNSQGDLECFPTYSYAAGNGESVTKTLTDYGFRAHPEDPMFIAPYKYPLNDYSGHFPPSADRPNEINHVDWLKIKRDITLDVLNQDLPLFAIKEVEHLEEVSRLADAEAFRSTHSTEATPTDAADFSVPIGTDSAGSGTGNSWRSGTRNHVPAETGVPEVVLEDSDSDSHMMRRRRQHLQEHQRGHGHGHGHGHH